MYMYVYAMLASIGILFILKQRRYSWLIATMEKKQIK